MNTLISIDKNIPLPPDGRGAPRKYLFSTMDVGDSFFVAGKLPGGLGSAAAALKKGGWRFTTRWVTENGVSGTRVWRVE